ncbi:MAG: DUF488 domain-containing protein [Gemmatimonadaceae bacterium]
MTIFTIGFTKSSAEHFFTRLEKARVRTVVDIRLNNVSQLAGFTKKDDLRYFLQAIGGIGYEHRPELAPTQDIIDGVRKKGGDWKTFEKKFLQLIASRHVERTMSRAALDGACLLCSEDTPEHCHRRLVAEYFKGKWGGMDIVHL